MLENVQRVTLTVSWYLSIILSLLKYQVFVQPIVTLINLDFFHTKRTIQIVNLCQFITA